MPNRFSSAKFSISQCDRCGFRFKLTKLKSLTIKTKNVNILVCQECWETDHPQLKLGMYPVNDPQAVRNPRPDFAEYPESRSYTEVINNGAGISLTVGILTISGEVFYEDLVGIPITLGVGAITSNSGTGATYFSGVGTFYGSFFAGQYFVIPVGVTTTGFILQQDGSTILLENGVDRLIF